MGVLTKVWAGDGEAAEMVSGVGFKPETLPPEGAREEREGRVTKGPLAKTWHCCREEPENDILASLCSHPSPACAPQPNQGLLHGCTHSHSVHTWLNACCHCLKVLNNI